MSEQTRINEARAEIEELRGCLESARADAACYLRDADRALAERDAAHQKIERLRAQVAELARAAEVVRRDDLTLLRVLELFAREHAHHARVAAAVMHSATDSGESNVEALAGLCLASLDDTDAARDFHRAAASARVRRAADRSLDLLDVADYCDMGLNSARARHWEAALYDIAAIVRLRER